MLRALPVIFWTAAVACRAAGQAPAHDRHEPPRHEAERAAELIRERIPQREQAASTPLRLYQRDHLAGFTVRMHPDAPAAGVTFRRVRAALLADLETIASRVPPAALAVLRESEILITPLSPQREGFSGRGMCFHESRDWLCQNGFDGEREGTVEICNMEDFLLWRAEQPMMVLHELAHAYHWRLGFDHPDVIEAYAAARDAGLYRAVPYALAPDGETREAYAMVNAKEYFAELSEALHGRNDYFPFTSVELRTHDLKGFVTVTRLWQLEADAFAAEQARAAVNAAEAPAPRP